MIHLQRVHYEGASRGACALRLSHAATCRGSVWCSVGGVWGSLAVLDAREMSIWRSHTRGLEPRWIVSAEDDRLVKPQVAAGLGAGAVDWELGVVRFGAGRVAMPRRRWHVVFEGW